MAANQPTATVRCRIESLTVPQLVGLTIAEVRKNFGAILNITANANPMLNGASVAEDYRLQANDDVNFVVALGEKGN